MAYSLDGVLLHDASKHWRLKAESQMNPNFAHTLLDFNGSGRDGAIQTRGYIPAPVITAVVTTDEADLQPLLRLFRLGSTLAKVGDATKYLNVELVSATHEKLSAGGTGLYKVVAVMRCPDVFWRDVSVTTYGPTTLTASPQTVACLTTTQAVVRDALICVAGSITGLVVSGARGSFFGYTPNVPTGQFLTFDSSTGRAWTGAAAFAQTTEVTGSVTNGPWPYFLELEASSTAAGCVATVSWTAATSATIRVKAANAYERN